MRKILFRGKRLDTCEWTYGYLDATMYKDIVVIHTDNGTHQVDVNTVGQYTGLTDKNGKEIFEGDIVRVAEYNNMLIQEFTEDENRFEIFDIEEAKGGLIRSYTTAISWEGGAFVYSSNGEYNDTLFVCLFGDMRRSYPIFEIEIVGDIHDNNIKNIGVN